MTGRKSSTLRRTAPVLENLEARQMLNASTPAADQAELASYDPSIAEVSINATSQKDRRFTYRTAQGAKVTIALLGPGSLAGTTLRSDGALDLVYDDTTSSSIILGSVRGGNGRAKLASIRDADLPLGSPSATGSNALSTVNLQKFDLVPNGYINLAGGIGTIGLRSAARNTQIQLTALPEPTSTATTPTSVDVIVDNFNPGTGTSTGSTGQNVTLISTGATATTEPAPTGVDVQIDNVKGARRSNPLGNAQIFGFDPVTSSVIRFDTATGAALQSTPVPAGGTALAGVGLGRNNGRLVALVGSGTTITAVDAISGTTVGQFSVANLAARGLTEIDAIGSSDVRTFVADSSAGVNGLVQQIDVTQSLATGQAVAVGVTYSPAREFELSGGLTGLAGASTIFATGAAHFDTFVPDRVQAGVLSFSQTALGIRETSRTALTNPITSTFIDAGVPGQAMQNPTMALGSIGPNLALVTGVVAGRNAVTLLNPSTIAVTGAVALNNPNRLAGLSESFHPELFDAALINVRGNLLRFVTQTATGVVVNSSGNVNLIAARQATDSAFVGAPLNHISIGKRRNVKALSTARGDSGTAKRGGVTVNSTEVNRLGVLTLP